MSIKKTLSVMCKTPLSHYRATSRYYSGYPIHGQWNVLESNTSMNRKVVDALLGLLNKGVPENLPGQIFSYTFNFFKCLIDWNSSNWDWRVTNNPLSSLMNIFTCGKIHNCISTPANPPDHFSNLFVYRRAEC